MSIARVFPRKTKASPVDALAFFDDPPLFLPDGISEVHISCAFTYDRARAEYLAKSWERTGLPVKVGGPAFGAAGGDFTPGMYLRQGYVITSRGCPNRCWFCSVWRREGEEVRELPITDGTNVQDDNLLACSEGHIRAVFAMLKRQRGPVQFDGGLEAARLRSWHAELLADLKPAQAFFAYDTADDLEPLREAGKMLADVGVSSGRLRCYVLCGYPKDTEAGAERRMRQAAEAGFFPHAMLYRDAEGRAAWEWRRFARLWARPAVTRSLLRQEVAA